jgi:hypothetical protein
MERAISSEKTLAGAPGCGELIMHRSIAWIEGEEGEESGTDQRQRKTRSARRRRSPWGRHGGGAPSSIPTFARGEVM